MAEAIDGLLCVVMVYSDGPWREVSDWSRAIRDLFGIVVSIDDVSAALGRVIEDGRIVYDRHSRLYGISPAASDRTLEQINQGDQLELRVQYSWLSDVESLVPEVGSEKLWSCLLCYMGKVFLAHGFDALGLLSGDQSLLESLPFDESPDQMLKHAMREVGISASHHPGVVEAISKFFESTDSDRVKYVSDLLGSTFNLLSLELDERSKAALARNLPPLTLFFDTNIIYGLIGAHVNPYSDAVVKLFEMIQRSNLQLNLYYHEKTLRELEYAIQATGQRLKSRQWTPSLSRAILTVPQAVSGIEVKYHTLNADAPTSVAIFLSRYGNIPLLLEEHGLKIFRDPPSSREQDDLRAQLVAEYIEFSRAARRTERKYEVLDHDISVWLSAYSRRSPRAGGPLQVGSMVVTGDHLFRQFDREVLAPEWGSNIWSATLPYSLLRALTPFVPSEESLDSIFARVFSMSEMRSIGRGYEFTIQRLTAYLATFEDLREETAVKLLADSVLIEKLKVAGDSKIHEIVDDHLVHENEALLRERDDFIEQARAIRTQLNGIEEEAGGSLSDALRAQLKNLEEAVSKLNDRPTYVFNGGSPVVDNSRGKEGGYYENKQSMVAAQGPGAHAEHVTQFADQRQQGLDVDIEELSSQLDLLRAQLISNASSASDYQAVAEVQAAKEAADGGDRARVLDHLAKAGKWALNAAQRIGLSLAEIALKKALGLE